MMSRHFRLSSELPGAIAKRLPHAKNQLSAPGSFFNQFVTDIDIYTSILGCSKKFIMGYVRVEARSCKKPTSDIEYISSLIFVIFEGGFISANNTF